jgi:hypothetical protein
MAGRKGDQGDKEKIATGMDEAGRGEVGKAGGEAGKGGPPRASTPSPPLPRVPNGRVPPPAWDVAVRSGQDPRRRPADRNDGRRPPSPPATCFAAITR